MALHVYMFYTEGQQSNVHIASCTAAAKTALLDVHDGRPSNSILFAERCVGFLSDLVEQLQLLIDS